MRTPAFALIAAFALAAPCARAADPAALPAATAASRNVHATLLSEAASVQPGQRFWLGLRLQMDPGWHVYWKQPGDSGLPPRLKWTLPAGVTAGDIAFPHPERFTAATLASYGYSGDVLLLVPMTAAAPVTPGSSLPLVVNASWLECRETCIPAKATLGLSLPVTAAPSQGVNAPLFSAARAAVPQRANGWRFQSDAQRIVLRAPRGWRPPAGAAVEFFAAQDNVIVFAAPQAAVAGRRGWGLALVRDPNGTVPATIQGVVVTRRGAHADAVEIDAAPLEEKQ